MNVKIALMALMANLMIFFLIAGAQTLDYNLTHNLPIPWQVWALFAASWKIHSYLPPSVHFKVIPPIHSKVTP